MREDKTLYFGKYLFRVAVLLLAPLTVGMLFPNLFVRSTVAEENNNLKPSLEASLSTAVWYDVVDYQPTDTAKSYVSTDNANGYQFTIEDGNAVQSYIGNDNISVSVESLAKSEVVKDNVDIYTLSTADIINGVQTDKVTFTTVANYAIGSRTIADIEYMQEMTSEICEATPTPAASLSDGSINTDVPEATLIDSRDGSTYVVRKLADGNCWMTQNLRLNLTGRTLTTEDSNVIENWTAENETQIYPGARWGSSSPTEEETNTAHSQVSENSEYGTYYNWYAATAGSGKYYMSTNEASSSICPKGWQLPHAEGPNSYSNLVSIYELSDTANLTTKDYLTSAPFSFALAGVYYYNGIIGGEGEWGDYWTVDVANLVTENFDLETASTNYNFKNVGFSVRCISK